MTVLIVAIIGWAAALGLVVFGWYAIKERDRQIDAARAQNPFEFPGWSLNDLTADPHQTGGQLQTTGTLQTLIAKGSGVRTTADMLQQLLEAYGGEYEIYRDYDRVRVLFTLPSGDRVTGIGHTTAAAVQHLAHRLGAPSHEN